MQYTTHKPRCRIWTVSNFSFKDLKLLCLVTIGKEEDQIIFYQETYQISSSWRRKLNSVSLLILTFVFLSLLKKKTFLFFLLAFHSFLCNRIRVNNKIDCWLLGLKKRNIMKLFFRIKDPISYLREKRGFKIRIFRRTF